MFGVKNSKYLLILFVSVDFWVLDKIFEYIYSGIYLKN